jgi:hypothetical protein
LLPSKRTAPRSINSSSAFDLLGVNLSANPLVNVTDRGLGVAMQVFEYQRSQAMRLNPLGGGLPGELEAAQQA